ncbi:MAG TPA: transporter, partial [Opitutus sp.]|nr:transporter [Opitutus sp.]
WPGESSLAAGVEAAANPPRFSWVHPVPESRMREMRTDRPDATESPFTVDAGHVQLEMDFANYARDEEADGRVTEWEAAPFNLRFGISRHFEAGLFVVPLRSETEVSPEGGRARRSGLGDITLRAKWNFAGNDGGDRAWGLIADLKLPTADDGMSNGKLEGAVALPVAFALGGGWEGAAMTVVEAVYTDAGKYRAVWSNTITAGRALSENVGGFVELTSSTGDGSHVATFNCGVTRRFGPHVQYDAGLNFGLSQSAPDIAVFTGLSRRF